MEDKKIKQAMPGRRDPTCYQTLHAILIPAGTTLRQKVGKEGSFSMPVAFGTFSIEGTAAAEHPETFKKVVA